MMCLAADIFAIPWRKQIVLVGPKHSAEFWRMIAAAHAAYEPNKTVIHVDSTNVEEMRFWEENNSNIAVMGKNNYSEDRVVALVCQNFTCSPPISSPDSLLEKLSGKSSSFMK